MSKARVDVYQPDTAIHPGVTLEGAIKEIGMSQLELAQRTGLTSKTINLIIKAKGPITAETAVKFERVLGISANLWNNLQRNYEVNLARIAEFDKIREESAIIKKFTCYAELEKWDYVPRAHNVLEKTKNLLSFFGIDSFSILSELSHIAFRKTATDKISIECLQAWLRCGELDARNVESSEFNKEKLKSALPSLRQLTTREPRDFGREMVRICADAGVTVTFTPYFSHTYVNGATRWIDGKPLVQLSLRFNYLDSLWFTFFHELGHIFKHGKKDRFIEFQDKIENQEEKEANQFAAEQLIPESLYKEFITSRTMVTRAEILKFASEIDVHPSIIAGRLAYDNKISWKDVAPLRQRIALTVA